MIINMIFNVRGFNLVMLSRIQRYISSRLYILFNQKKYRYNKKQSNIYLINKIVMI